MKKILIFALILLSILYLYNNTLKKEIIIPDEAIRFRVIANSNTIYDQNIKIQVRNVVQNKILELINNSTSLSETRKILEDNTPILKEIVQETLDKLNYDKDFKINYGYNFFPKKKYKGIEYDEGKYESLVITLGDGYGDNWWCVLFPPLCLIEAEDNTQTNAEYTFFLKELIDKYIH